MTYNCMTVQIRSIVSVVSVTGEASVT